MASQYLLSNRVHLPRYPQGRVVSRADHSYRLAVPAGPAVRARAPRSSGRRCGWRVQVKQKEIQLTRKIMGV